MKENKNENVCERNFDGRFFRIIVLGGCPTIHVEGAHEFFWRVILQIHLKGLCEGVGEDSRHGIGHVDIQVGSCICLSVIVCHDMCT